MSRGIAIFALGLVCLGVVTGMATAKGHRHPAPQHVRHRHHPHRHAEAAKVPPGLRGTVKSATVRLATAKQATPPAASETTMELQYVNGGHGRAVAVLDAMATAAPIAASPNASAAPIDAERKSNPSIFSLTDKSLPIDTAANGSAVRPAGVAVGTASYYGAGDSRRTASGERFDPHALTAAHRSLPFGSKVKVTNLSNGKAVVVRINDRGPFSHGRLIDLSRSAAEALGFISRGLAKVKIERI